MKLFEDRETNPTDFDKLGGYNPNRPRICSPLQPGQINARPRKWELGTVQKIPSRESWGDLSGDRYIICPKPPHPAEKILDRRQFFFLANHNSPEQTLYTRLNLNEVEQEVDDDWDTVSVNSRAKRPQMNGEAYITETNVIGMCTSKQRTSTNNIFNW